ncbi:reverse transcriptase domain-containing protein [Tanacetum coccineum]
MKNKTNPIQLDFDEEDIVIRDTCIVKGKDVIDDDLKKPFKEALKTPLTRRIIEFVGPEYKMPANIKPSGQQKACFKKPHEITKIVRRANESLTAFKERWTVETGFIMGVPEVMKISSFIDSLKCPELAKRFSDKTPTTVTEMMRRLDDFVRSEKYFAQTELPKGETRVQHRKLYFPPVRKDDRPFRNNHHVTDQRRYDPRNNYRGRDTATPFRGKDNPPPHPPPKGDHQTRVAPILTMDALTKYPKEILATETHLHLAPPRPMINPQRAKPSDEGRAARGRGNQKGDGSQQAKIINMVGVRSLKEKKRKEQKATERWMNTPISFPPISEEDISDEPLIVEAEVEGYLVRRIYVDGGASVEVMFEHCFKNLSPRIKARLKETQTDLVGFTGEATKPLGKIELEICFGGEGLCRRKTMKFTIIRAPSPYNVILGRMGLRALSAIPSTIHAMMKFPTPRGITTLVTRSVIISECKRLEKRQVIEEEKKEEVEARAVNTTKEVLVNLAFLD